MNTIESRYVEIDRIAESLNKKNGGFHGYSSAELINKVGKEKPELLPLLGGSADFLSEDKKLIESPQK